jgi:hypothetical protein
MVMGTDGEAGSVSSATPSQVSEMTTRTVAAAKTPNLPPSSRSGSRYPYRRGFKKPAATNDNTPTVLRKPKFVGAVDELEGNIYDCNNSRQSDIYVKTTIKIAEYVGRSLKYGDDARIAIDNMSLVIPGLTIPDDYDDKTAKKSEIRIWEKKVDEYVKRSTLLDQNMRTVYNIVLGQCTDIMRQKLAGLSNFNTLKQNGDGLGLLRAIKDTTFEFQGEKFVFDALHDSSVRAALCKQGKHMTTQEYMELFQNVVDVIEHSGGSIGYAPAGEAFIAKSYDIDVDTAQPEELLMMAKESKDWFLATAFLKGADKTRYGKLIEDTRNSFLQGNNNFPRTVQLAYNLLVNWRQDRVGMQGASNDGVAFAHINSIEEEDDKDGESTALTTTARQHRDPATVTCFKCREKGHYANKCPNDKFVAAGTNLFMSGEQLTSTQLLMSGIEDGDFDASEKSCSGFSFHISGEPTSLSHTAVTLQVSRDGGVPDTWILLDNQSTVDVFHNKNLLVNIRPTNTSMNIHCNAGVTNTNLIGDLPGYGTVWYHPKGIANILSLSKVKNNGNRVTYDSAAGNEFHVHKPDGKVRVFSESERGLYFMDASASKTENLFVNTVEDNKAKFTSRDYSQAILARKIQKTIGRPSTRTFINIVKNNLLRNCPITTRDIQIAEEIFGPDVGILKGKTVRRSAERVATGTVDIPLSIMTHYRDIVLGGDIMFVNKLPFFMTISRNIKFGTAELLANQTNKTILSAVRQVKALYMKRGFRLNHMLMDGQFESIRGDLSLMQIELNCVSADEHVPEIERHIRTVKERCRCVYNTLPFKKLPNRIVTELVYYSTFWLNSFPVNDGVSKVLSPRSLIVGMEIDYSKHCQLEFGTYVQTHEEHDNSMHARTTGAITLRPTGNLQGGYYFFSLTTGRRLNRNNWTVLPMPNEVIDRVHTLARRSRNDKGLTFLDRDGNNFLDENDSDDEEDYFPDENDNYDEDEFFSDDESDVSITGVHIAPDISTAGVTAEQNMEDDTNMEDDINEDDIAGVTEEHNMEINTNDNAEDEIIDMNTTDENPIQNDNVEVPTNANDEDDLEGNTNNTIQVNDESDSETGDDEREAPLSRLRPRRKVNYSHIKVMREPEDYSRYRNPSSNLHASFESTLMTQHSMKKGIKVFGQAGIDAVLSELKQLHDRKVLEPKNDKEMTDEDRKRSLQYLMFLKKKSSGQIKGRGCADGRKQREHIPKEDASSPTVAIESVMLTSVIDAKEGRDVATVDIPGAFMQVDQEDLVHMKMEGKMAELLVKLDPKLYRKYVQIEKGKKVLYVQLKKALYGTLKAALLFWKKLTEKIEEWGFVINPYDWCVANKIINKKQCTIIWHVDDLKISHVDAEVNTHVISLINNEFGQEAPLTITRGKVHEYLGMTLDFSNPGKVKIIMKEYIQGMLNEIPDDMDGVAVTPAPRHIFDVNETNPVKLDEDKSVMFHHNVAKLLFLCKRAKPDIQTAVAFLCTRVKSPDEDDYKKLARVMKYLRATIHIPLTLEADNLRLMKWWVDAAFAVHPDMKGHTGGTFSLGRGSIYSASTKQKLNTKSSTESELVGVNDMMPQILWTCYFMQAQGYGADQSLIAQDNLSAMLLENNGRASSSKRTRHINIRYFFVTDRIKAGEVRVAHCPTDDMIADYFTKALQGTKFRQFRDFIMNVDPSTSTVMDRRSVLGNIKLPVDTHGTKQNSNGIEADARVPVNAVHPNKPSFLSDSSVRRTHRYKPPD